METNFLEIDAPNAFSTPQKPGLPSSWSACLFSAWPLPDVWNIFAETISTIVNQDNGKARNTFAGQFDRSLRKGSVYSQKPYYRWPGWWQVPQLGRTLRRKAFLPGSKDSGTNPEQLFAAGWSACFLSAIKIAGAKMRINVPVDAAIDAELDLCSDGESYFLRARLNISLPGLENEIAMSLISSAHRICPYSNATRGNIDVNIKLI